MNDPVEYTEFGIALDDDDFLERPQRHGGEILRIDRHANCVESRQYPSPEWWEWYRLFGKADPLCRFFIGQAVMLKDGSTGTVFDVADSNGENAEACMLPQDIWIPLESLRPCL